MLTNNSGLPLSLAISLVLLSGCASSQQTGDAVSTQEFGKPSPPVQPMQSMQPPPPMQPLQPGQPPQKPERSISTVPAVVGGQPGTTQLRFNQPFRLVDQEYQFMAAKGKDHVGLDTRPALRPSQGYIYFLVRYQVINHGGGALTVPNTAAVHLLNLVNKQVCDIDQAATNANVQSGAATGMPDRLVLEPERPQIQTLAFQVPTTTNAGDLAILVTKPSDPRRVFQIVSLAN